MRRRLDEWLTRIEHSIKPSMTQNWRNYAAYYVIPYIGQREVQDITGAVCDALYAKLLAEGRVKARPKKRPTTRAVHRRRLGPSGQALPCRPYSYDTVRCFHTHAEDDPAIGQPITPKKLGQRAAEEAAESARRRLNPGLEPKTVGKHASRAPQGLGGLHDLGMGQAECRQRRAPSPGATQGPQGLERGAASDVPAARPI